MNLDYRYSHDKDFHFFNDKLDILKINQEKFVLKDCCANLTCPIHRIQNLKKEYLLSLVFANGKIVEIEDSWFVDSNNGSFVSYESLLFDFYNNKVHKKKGIDDRINQETIDIESFLYKGPKNGIKTYSFAEYTSNCTYNQGRLVKDERIYKDGHLEILNYEYNEMFKISKILKNVGGRTFVDTAYEYDSNGNEIFVQWIHNYNTMEIRRGITRYDQYGNVVFEDNYYNGVRILKKFIYQYDDHNNWIERRTVIDNSLVEIDIREILYLY